MNQVSTNACVAEVTLNSNTSTSLFQKMDEVDDARGLLGGKALHKHTRVHTHLHGRVNHTHGHRNTDNGSPKSDKDNTFRAAKSYSGLLKTHGHSLTRTHSPRLLFLYAGI